VRMVRQQHHLRLQRESLRSVLFSIFINDMDYGAECTSANLKMTENSEEWVIECFGLEETFRGHLVQPSCSEQ